MFYYLSKFLGFFALPTNALIALGCLGAVLLATRFVRAGRRMLVASALLLGLLGWSPLPNILLAPLEERFPPWQAQGRDPDGLVVLGGGIDEVVSEARDAVTLFDSSERVTAAVVLARRYPNARIAFSGGTGMIHGAVPEAVFARRFFQEMGIAPERIIVEDRARNTSENAIFTRRLLDPKPGERWLLVTSAFHMPRSMGIFRQENFAVEAYPVDWRTRGARDAGRGFERAAEGLQRADIAVREWVGLLVYWLTGRSAALFPGP
ncbi:MAG: YdcF family protein [Variibacter sp.]|nr:YdcF family protein [Variibacter sp.]